MEDHREAEPLRGLVDLGEPRKPVEVAVRSEELVRRVELEAAKARPGKASRPHGPGSRWVGRTDPTATSRSGSARAYSRTKSFAFSVYPTISGAT